MPSVALSVLVIWTWKKETPQFYRSNTSLGMSYSWGLAVGKLLKNQGNKSLCCFSSLPLWEPCFQGSEGISRLLSSTRHLLLNLPTFLVLSSLPLLTLRPDLTKRLWRAGLQWMESGSCAWSLPTPILHNNSTSGFGGLLVGRRPQKLVCGAEKVAGRNSVLKNK